MKHVKKEIKKTLSIFIMTAHRRIMPSFSWHITQCETTGLLYKLTPNSIFWPNFETLSVVNAKSVPFFVSDPSTVNFQISFSQFGGIVERDFEKILEAEKTGVAL